MAGIPYTPNLREEYRRLFDTCTIRPERRAQVRDVASKLEANQARYSAVAQRVGAPWYFVAIVHSLEAGRDFGRHLHNGDPLTARTTSVPKGRPEQGNPPFTWEESAADALSRLRDWRDWDIPGLLYKLEEYNGWGYRLHHPEVRSPYLWSSSNHYAAGKYVKDGKFSPTAVSEQCGGAGLLRWWVESGRLGPSDDWEMDVRMVRRPDRPEVYVVLPAHLEHVPNEGHAAYLGLDLSRVELRPQEDPVWNLPRLFATGETHPPRHGLGWD